MTIIPGYDLLGMPMVSIWTKKRYIRIFYRPWPLWKPFAFRRYGLTGVGLGFIGLNLWRNRG